MRGQFGEHFKLTIFGESHGPAIGMVIDGIPAGTSIDEAEIARHMARRAPGNDPTATARKEADHVLHRLRAAWRAGDRRAAVRPDREHEYPLRRLCADERADAPRSRGLCGLCQVPRVPTTRAGAGTFPGGSPRRWCLPGASPGSCCRHRA